MRLIFCMTLCGAMISASSVMARPAEKEKSGKRDLVTLYLLSVAAERCGFAMTARQADAIDRAARSLAESLKFGTRQANAMYSAADIAFEKQGPAACDRNGSFAKEFRETLHKMTGP
jgi:hypothetical protein